MNIYLTLFLESLMPVAQSVLVYFILNKMPLLKKLPYMAQQAIIGVFFGISAILGTVLSVKVGEFAGANVRDAAPLCAGLMFGGPAGIIAGFIGGLYRLLDTFLITGNGLFSVAACSISTAFAGILAALLRRFIFDKKAPSWLFGMVTAIVMEVIHLTLLFILRLDDVETAFSVVERCTIPMIALNAVGVTVALLVVKILSGEKFVKWNAKPIAEQVQSLLLIVVILAYLATTLFVYTYQTNTSISSAKETIETNITDIRTDVVASDGTMISTYAVKKHIGKTGILIIANQDNDVLSLTYDEAYEQYFDIYEDPDTGTITAIFTKSGIKTSDLGLNIDTAKGESDVFSAQVCGSYCLVDYTSVQYDGTTTFFVIVAMKNDEVFASRKTSIYVNSFMEVLVFAVLFIMVYGLIKRLVVNNLHKVNNKLGKIIQGDLDTYFDIEASQEFIALSGYINSTVNTLKQYIDDAAKRLDKELEFAKNIQHSALPSVFPPYPNIKEFDIYASMDTAKQVGGDFYDFYLIGDKKLAFMVADVSGKGIPAAMFMMRAKTLLKSLAETGMPLDEVFYKANNKLCENNETGMFVTSWMGVLDISTGEIESVNAGHEIPFLYRKGKGFTEQISKHGLFLGGMENVNYKVEKYTLGDGDMIFQYTDGVTEAGNFNKELFGMERLKNALNGGEATPNGVLESVKQNIDLFVGEEPQFDDITMICLKYNKTKKQK